MNIFQRYRYTFVALLSDCLLITPFVVRFRSVLIGLSHWILDALAWLGTVAPLLITSFVSLILVFLTVSLLWSLHRKAFQEITAKRIA